jgi:hypothetical protein
MTNRDPALEYPGCYCDGNIAGLEPLPAPALKFKGTFHTYSSSEEYLAHLRSDPPQKSKYSILSITENAESVTLFYEYLKPGHVIQIAQLFKMSKQQISEILPVFDGRNIA